eukprot:TRINITY_DN30319_c0_g1_i4.p2 TRINITY_DN30319_c0_g1~~TRINITY_DN30319_c0_g1_i4.p2  ORF type:complete len:198 (+),score=0.28 TRINITY_DN30319_c0_g1_i4:124-717(+)
MSRRVRRSGSKVSLGWTTTRAEHGLAEALPKMRAVKNAYSVLQVLDGEGTMEDHMSKELIWGQSQTPTNTIPAGQLAALDRQITTRLDLPIPTRLDLPIQARTIVDNEYSEQTKNTITELNELGKILEKHEDFQKAFETASSKSTAGMDYDVVDRLKPRDEAAVQSQSLTLAVDSSDHRERRLDEPGNACACAGWSQ